MCAFALISFLDFSGATGYGLQGGGSKGFRYERDLNDDTLGMINDCNHGTQPWWRQENISGYSSVALKL